MTLRKRHKSLAEECPEKANLWHPTKNRPLTPKDITVGSDRKVWWFLPYDDPKTGKHFDFEWPAPLYARTLQGQGCPYLSGKAVWPGFNDLATTHPDIAAEWHPTKNGNLTPQMVTYGSNKKVWWLLHYDDPKTGKSFDFEWPAYIVNRTTLKNDCPFLSGKDVYVGFNDLATTHPDIAAEWHPTKNGKLTPQMFTSGSKQRVWWLLHYDDPITGKSFDFEWPAIIETRVVSGCPYLSGNKVWKGYNDLKTRYPEIAAQWHPTKNGNITPDMVLPGSPKNYWWIFPYDDPITGKHFDFEWPAPIGERVQAKGCPFLSGQRVWIGYNDFASLYPDIAKQWHPTKNNGITPYDVTWGSELRVWWLFPYDDPKTGKHFDFEWQAQINSRQSTGCPFLSSTNPRAWPGFNDLATVNPALAKEWHPTKNGDLLPTDVTQGSDEIVWWFLPYDDPKTGKHFDFEWPATVKDRQSTGCPFLSSTNPRAWPGFNDLATVNPALAKEWHPTKNGDLSPTDVTQGSKEIVWWLLPYDDPKTGKHFDFVWDAPIYERLLQGDGCPYLSNRRVWPGYNDLATCFPTISEEWHPSKNRKANPSHICKYSTRKYWWLCKACGNIWYASVSSRTRQGTRCSKCNKVKIYY